MINWYYNEYEREEEKQKRLLLEALAKEICKVKVVSK